MTLRSDVVNVLALTGQPLTVAQVHIKVCDQYDALGQPAPSRVDVGLTLEHARLTGAVTSPWARHAETRTWTVTS